jgi:hypothetical protein
VEACNSWSHDDDQLDVIIEKVYGPGSTELAGRYNQHGKTAFLHRDYAKAEELFNKSWCSDAGMYYSFPVAMMEVLHKYPSAKQSFAYVSPTTDKKAFYPLIRSKLDPKVLAEIDEKNDVLARARYEKWQRDNKLHPRPMSAEMLAEVQQIWVNYYYHIVFEMLIKMFSLSSMVIACYGFYVHSTSRARWERKLALGVCPAERLRLLSMLTTRCLLHKNWDDADRYSKLMLEFASQ